MNRTQKKTAAQVVGLAKRKAAAREAVGLLTKAAESRRKRLAKAAVGALGVLLKQGGPGWVPRKPHEPYQGSGWVPRKPHEPYRKPGWTPPKPHEPYRGKTPVKPAVQNPNAPAPTTPAPTAPAPARMKATPSPKPAPAPLQAYRKVSAEQLMGGLFIKAAADVKKARAMAYKRAALLYISAVKRGNKAHIKKATAHLAGVITFDTMTKQSVTAEIGSALMRLLSKITPALTTTAKLGGPGYGQWAGKAMKWGEGIGAKGQNVKDMLQSNPTLLASIMQKLPDATGELALAKQIGTGALAGGAGLLGGKYLMD